MRLISHRGNIRGRNCDRENTVEYIDECLNQGYDCEIDLWMLDDKLFLGHDLPSQEVSEHWLFLNRSNIWIHCKNAKALSFLASHSIPTVYFWHSSDDFTCCSNGIVWCHYLQYPIENSIFVMPEATNSIVKLNKILSCINLYGICSDYIGEIDGKP